MVIISYFSNDQDKPVYSTHLRKPEALNYFLQEYVNFRLEEQWRQEEEKTHLQPVTGAAIWGHTMNLLDFNFEANFNNPNL